MLSFDHNENLFCANDNTVVQVKISQKTFSAHTRCTWETIGIEALKQIKKFCTMVSWITHKSQTCTLWWIVGRGGKGEGHFKHFSVYYTANS